MGYDGIPYVVCAQIMGHKVYTQGKLKFLRFRFIKIGGSIYLSS
jgi:hypothetical protein